MIFAGFACAPVSFPLSIFPNPKENYTHVHDDPQIHVLIIEDKERFAFAFAGIVDPGDWDAARKVLADAVGAPVENVVFHTSHVLSTPHCFHGEYPNEAEKEKDLLLRKTIMDAISTAAQKAASAMEPVSVGVGYAYSQINVNRVLESAEGYVEGTNEAGDTDHSVPLLCFKKESEELKAVVYTVNTAAGVLEHSKLSDGSRPVSGDIAAASERKIKELLGIPAAYTLGASGDQWQILRAMEDGLDVHGKQYKVDRMEQGFDFVEILSNRLAQSVMHALPTVHYSDGELVPKLYTRTVTLPAHKELPPPVARKIARSVTFEPAPDVRMEYHVFCMGDTAIICCKPEVCVATLREIRDNSPFTHTILLEFTNNHANYMVTKDLYEKCAPQSRKGYFSAGAAEIFAADAITFLHEIYISETDAPKHNI